MNALESITYYFGNLRLARRRAGLALWAMVAIFALLPSAVRAVLDPWEIQRLRHLLGHSEPWAIWQCELVAVVTLAMLVSTLNVALISFYRRTGGVPMWPLVLLVGTVGSGLWWYYCDFFDVAGLVAGAAPIGLMNFLEQRAMARVFPSRALQRFDAGSPDAMFDE